MELLGFHLLQRDLAAHGQSALSSVILKDRAGVADRAEESLGEISLAAGRWRAERPS
jgi:hypothetical protein